ncbi:MAG: exodeoxyribonuclease I [Gammaproteobacteria bacterium]|jgi:exodeoxyribonuclease-1|nr:exodeoxyribonuclease I [Gammaproteobacteria bacterium]
MNEETFLWHDFETFGADPRRDRPAQFAAQRTDAELRPVGDPIMIYCRPADDVLPQPMACLITGITPQTARERGVPENEFAAAVFQAMAEPNTCSVGYNNFRFDDEVTRHLFWRNFIDPYRREWADGNSRFDLIDLLRMMRALRPDGLEWPDHPDGRPSFRLEDLAAANGFDTSNAHDALADVRATIELAQRIHELQPRLWEWSLSLRNRDKVVDLLSGGVPLLHASSRFPALPACGVAPVLPICKHPHIASQWIVWNLGVDPRPFLELDSAELADRFWTPSSDLPEGIERLPIKLVRSNRSPILAPMSVLHETRASALEILPPRVEDHARLLGRHPEFASRLAGLFQKPGGSDADPELDLYGGFPPRSDRPVMDRVLRMRPGELGDLDAPFVDERLNELLFRYRARLWPESLDASERARWEQFRQRRLREDPDLASIRLDEYRAALETLRLERPEAAAILQQLEEWPGEIGLPTP